MRQVVVQPFQEAWPILPSFGRPRRFGQCSQAGEGEVEHVFGLVAEFCPQAGLHAHQQWFVFGFPVGLHRFIVINALQRVVAEISHRLEPLRALVADEVEDAGRSHDEAVALCGGFQGGMTESLPAQNDGFIGQFAVGQLVPAYHFLPFAAHVVGHTTHKVALQGFCVCQVFAADACLAQGAFSPMGLACLVTSQMDIAGREEGHHFIQYVLQEGIRLIIAGAEDDIGIVSSQTGQYPDEVLHRGAGILRIRGQGGVGVGRYVNFGDDLNLTFGGMADDFLHVFLRVKSADGGRFARLWIAPFGESKVTAIHAPRTHFGQAGIFLDFQAPAVIVGQMQVQAVDFQQGDAVYQAKHVFLGQEIAGHVQHIASVAEAGFVLDGHSRYAPIFFLWRVSLNGRGQHQAQTLQGIEVAARVGGGDVDAFRGYTQGVGFGFQGGVRGEDDVAFLPGLYRGGEASCLCEQTGKAFCYGTLCFVGNSQYGLWTEMERSVSGFDRKRLGY